MFRIYKHQAHPFCQNVYDWLTLVQDSESTCNFVSLIYEMPSVNLCILLKPNLNLSVKETEKLATVDRWACEREVSTKHIPFSRERQYMVTYREVAT